MRPTVGSVDKYIARSPAATRKVLKALRTLIRKTAPGVSERISYGIPTFDLKGQRFLYLAGFKKHVAIYPVTGGMTRALGAALKPYRRGKGTLRFPLGTRVPIALIRRIIRVRRAEIS